MEERMAEDRDKPLDPADIRWKMTVACDICRRRKVRCDGDRPCSRCVKGHQECTFSLPKHKHNKKGIGTPSKRRRPASAPVDAQSQSEPAAESSTQAQRRASNFTGNGPSGLSSTAAQLPSANTKEHLLLIDSDDQIVYSGPSSGIPLFARLGLLRTVEMSESANSNNSNTARLFTSHSSAALGITGAMSASKDYLDMCFECCPLETMSSLIGHHLNSPVFFPLLHAPSFLAEFVAVTQRQLKCTGQYGAFLMSLLAVTTRLVEPARNLVPAAYRSGEKYYDLAQNLLRVSRNKLDIRHILALYHLALFAEGRNASAGASSSFVAEAIGLGFTTGLHRSTSEFNMDPVTTQIRTRLFWALYSLDIALAYSQGRPNLIKLSECSVELPTVVENEYITKVEILPQPHDKPAVLMASAVAMTELYIVLEQVLSAINAPSATIYQKFALEVMPRSRSDRLKRAEARLTEMEAALPEYLKASILPITSENVATHFQAARVRSTVLFVRTLISRQMLIDELETSPEEARSISQPSAATLAACTLSVEIVKTYSRLRHLGFLQHCPFNAVSHLTAAGHTLVACMLRGTDLAYEYRPDLLTAIDILLIFASRYPCAENVAQMLVQLSRELDLGSSGERESSEALAIRVLARKMAVSPTNGASNLPIPQGQGSSRSTSLAATRTNQALQQQHSNSYTPYQYQHHLQHKPNQQQNQHHFEANQYNYDWLVRAASTSDTYPHPTSTSAPSSLPASTVHPMSADGLVTASYPSQQNIYQFPCSATGNDNGTIANGDSAVFPPSSGHIDLENPSGAAIADPSVHPTHALPRSIGWSGANSSQDPIVFEDWDNQFSFLNDGLFGAL